MSEKIGWNISIQQIHIFLQAMELKNFSQVASALNFTPSMVSKTIISMENELEVTLFVRKPHELTPTPAAKLLAEEWRQLIGSYDNSLAKVRALQKNLASRILLSFVDSSNRIDLLMKRLLSLYGGLFPGRNIIVEKHDMHRAAELLNFGLLDLAVTSEIEVPYLDEHHIPWEQLIVSGTAVYIPQKNALFEKQELLITDLKEQPFVSLDPKMHPCYNRWLFHLCSSYGFVPQIESTFRTVRSLLFNLDLQAQIFIGDTITSDWCSETLRCCKLPATSGIIIAWRAGSYPLIKELKDLIKEEFDQNCPELQRSNKTAVSGSCK